MGRSLPKVAAAFALGWLACAPVAAVAAGGGETSDRRATPLARSAAPAAGAAPVWLVDRVRVVPLDPITKPLTVAGLGAYPGQLELSRPSAAGLAVLNHVSFDDYLRGISEMPSAWPFEALKAQAVAARTYALWHLRRSERAPVPAHRAAGADICATQSCQVYTGLAKVRAPHGDRWAAAVQATAGQVLWWREGPILAKYSSSNGGRSVAGGQPYLRAVDDPDDAHSPLHRWQATITHAELTRVFALPADPARAAREGDTVVLEAPRAAPASDAEPSAPGWTVRIPVVEFRDRVNAALGAPAGLPRRIPSVRFATKPTEGGVVIDGAGWGHGIGLGQWGAFGKAVRGMKAADILASYYAGIRPAAVPEGGSPETVAVALGLDRRLVEVDAENRGRFRIETASGDTIAHAATGTWRFQAGPGGKVRVQGPADQATASSVEHLETIPATPRPGQAITVRLRVPRAARLSASAVAPPAGSPQAVGDAVVVDEGEVRLRLPAARAAGVYAVTVDTDLGGGRTSSTPLALKVSRGGNERSGHERATADDRAGRGGARASRHGPAHGEGGATDGAATPGARLAFDLGPSPAPVAPSARSAAPDDRAAAGAALRAGPGAAAAGAGPAPTTALGALASITVANPAAPRAAVLFAAVAVAAVAPRVVRAVRLGRRRGAPLHWQGP